MAVELALAVRKFKVRFPEFKESDDDEIRAKLEDAQSLVNANRWGDRRLQGIGYLAAHLLASAPLGEQARLSLEKRGTIYGQHYDNLKRIVVTTPTVI